MNKIVTISREFGSGGRELGKRLADALQIPCYDHEIIEMIADHHGFDKDYVAHISEKDIRAAYPLTIGRRFASPHFAMNEPLQVAITQQKIIRQFANQGDCVIVGRCADIILQDMKPMNLFVYADQPSKLRRCAERTPEGEHFSSAEMVRKMRQVDKNRAAYRGLFTDSRWGQKEAYHLCINTSGKEIKALVPPLAVYVSSWFGK